MPAALKAIAMVHDVDPKQAIWDDLNPNLGDIEPLGSRIMVAVYERPERTKGGILLTAATRKEDAYQGKVGLILKTGPLAFVEDATHRWGAAIPKIGDWVAFRVGDTHPFLLNERTCRLVEDVYVQMILQRPDMIL